MKKIKIHPAAEAFPMMPEDELEELAEDIKANGLRHPILLDKDGVLIDGRNRFEACKRAGVEPKFETLNGQDTTALVVSESIARRNISKGQRAMAFAILYPDPENRWSGLKIKPDDVNKGSLSQARSVLNYAPDIVKLVVQGAMPLSQAYDIAMHNKKAIAQKASDMDRLSTEAPDLAGQVIEGELDLDLAMAELKKRKDEAELIEIGKREDRKEMCRWFDGAILRMGDKKLIEYAPEHVTSKEFDQALKFLQGLCEEICP
jgi:ParB-like nuclease domain